MVEAMEIVDKAERFEQKNEDQNENEVEEEEEESEVSKWESEVPRMVLRILLVEADDSTRQIVTALLRKCGYTVSAVSDGLTAWETLKESGRSIDLILTEMDLPLISGFALLSLVMEHDVCKEIPVIIMSTQDSVSMVFNCMLKGAVDYLIKPVRRNELKNLWQHVWRRNTLFQRQVPQNLTVQHQLLEPAFGNNLLGNRSSDSLVSAPTTKDRSEKGSDAQSSCTTPYKFEAESEKVLHKQDYSMMKCLSDSKFTETNVRKEDGERFDQGLVMEVCETGEKSNLFKPEVVSCNGAYKSFVLRLEEDHYSAKRAKLDESVQANLTNETKSCCDEMRTQSREVDTKGIFGKLTRCNNSHSDGIFNYEYPPRTELSLRGYHSWGTNSQVANEETKLIHSNASAFSWYNNSSTFQPLFVSLPNDSSQVEEAVKKSEETSLFSQSSVITIKDSQKHEQSMSIDQYWNNQVSPQSPKQLEPVLVTGLHFEKLSTGHYGQFLPSLHCAKLNLSHALSPISESQRERSPFDTNKMSSPFEEQEHHNSVDQTTQNRNDPEIMEDSKPIPLDTDHSRVIDAHEAKSEECTTSIEAFDEDVKGTLAPNQSFRSNLNSQYVHEKFRGMDSVWKSQREAALAKFRMKRKDRCFEKKVRYQSRKKLAEQRPRVKGQFVRQSAS